MNNNVNRKTSLAANLDTLPGIPGDNYEPAAAWQKLEKRLHTKPAKKNRFYLWLAAACIILLLALLPFLRKETPATTTELVATPDITATFIPATNGPAVETAVTNNTAQTNLTAPTVAGPLLPDGNPTQQMPAHKNIVTPDHKDSFPDSPIIKESLVLTSPTPLLPPDTLAIKGTVAQSVPDKRIVHINDLMDPVMDDQSAALKEQNKLKRFVQRKNIKQDANAYTETPSPNHTIIKHIN